MTLRDMDDLANIYERASLHTGRISPRTDYTSPVVAVVLFTIFACLAWPLFSDGDYNIKKYAYALQDMASRMSLGLVRRPLPGDTSALKTVFGLSKTGLKGLGTDTLQRGFGGIRSMVKGGGSGSDAPAGLGNWDNSCYQNSVIQGLASLRSLPDFLYRVASKSAGGASMNEALLHTVGKLNNAENNGKALWLPPELKTMSTWQQQDAQEYFSKILDKLDKEAIKVARRRTETKYDLSLSETKEEVDHAKGEREETLLRNPIDGMIAQRVGCKTCGHSDGISLFPFNCLTVPLGHASHYDIRDCLDEYTALETIDGVQCPKCTLLAFKSKLEAMAANASSSDTLRQHLEQRLNAVNDALANNDFSDLAITKKCQIPKAQWVESTKTKQAVVARAPQGLVLHVNRSMFDGYTGAQIKNPAAVQFPATFGLGQWMLGSIHERPSSTSPDHVEPEKEETKEEEERWSMDPRASMLPSIGEPVASDAQYELRAVVTHFGRHENGHYVCYRKHPLAKRDVNGIDEHGDQEEEVWWRLSDEDVTRVGEDYVLRQGGVFMLFYERVDETLGEPSGEILAPFKADAAVAAVVADAAMVPLPADDEEDFEVRAEVPDISEDASLPSLSSTVDPASKRMASFKGLPTPPESVCESITESDIDSTVDGPTASGPSYTQEPVQVVRMRTSNIFTDDKNKSSSESLLMGSRMVSAS